ncbi:MAG: hypothetical protein IJM62_00145 [Lachnospiraceae bacterium]|nr:hypothetical protein [Lachnospiraceae bacterium]
MKRLLSLVLSVMLAIGVTACGSSKEETVVGNWELSEVTLGENTYSVEDYGKVTHMEGYTVYLEVGEDGTFVMKVPYFNNYESRGNWEQDGDTYKAVVDGDALTFELKDGKLMTTNGKETLNAEYIFVRK